MAIAEGAGDPRKMLPDRASKTWWKRRPNPPKTGTGIEMTDILNESEFRMVGPAPYAQPTAIAPPPPGTPTGESNMSLAQFLRTQPGESSARAPQRAPIRTSVDIDAITAVEN